ncbi:MAG TPA: hypothetical protein VF540_12205 [Segetibacter sp.]
MKKLSAILLIALFLFNLFGYRILFNYEQQQSDVRLEASLDKQDYNEADLVTIKVPLSLPYVNNQQNFERVDGEITVNGKILKYVKRKITDGNLILLCVPNDNKMRIESAKEEFFKYANDLMQNNHSNKSSNTKSGVSKNLMTEYYINTFSDCAPAFSIRMHTYDITSQSKFLPPSHYNLPERPPEII